MSGSTSFYNAPAGADATPTEMFGASWVQDSGLARSVEEGVQVVRRFGAFGPRSEPGYNAFRDEGLRAFLIEHPDTLHMFVPSQSAEESAFISDRVKQLKGREAALEAGGAFWSRMAAGVLSPEALATLPIGLGAATAPTRLGRAAQVAAKSGGINAGLTAVEDLSEAGSLPDSIAPNIAADVALSALFGAALGGVAGSLTGRSLDQTAARHAAAHDAADGLKTPGVPPELRPAAMAGEVGPGRLTDEGEVDLSLATITPEGATAAMALVQKLVGPHAIVEFGDVAPGTRAVAIGPLVRFGYDLSDAELPTIARHEAVHSLRKMGLLTDVEWDALETTARSEDWLGKHKVEDRWGKLGLNDTEKLEEAIAEEFGTWVRSGEPAPSGLLGQVWAKMKEFFANLVSGLRAQGMDAESIFKRIESGEVGQRTPAEWAMDQGLRADLRSYLDLWSQGKADGPMLAEARQLEPAPMAGAAAPPPPAPPATGAAAAAAPAPPDPKSQRFAPGSGARAITWNQMKYYVLKNNPFQGTAGQALAKWASELMQDPGLRMEGTNAATSVEALTKQGGYRFHQVSTAMDRLYYQHAGWDPEAATPARSRIEEARQRLPGQLGAVPQGKLTMQEFEAAVFRATAGEDNPAWPPEVREAAAAWKRDFFDPYEQELATAGVVLSGKYKAESTAAVARELDGYERRAKALEARIKDKTVPQAVRFRLQALWEVEKAGVAGAKARLKSVADMATANEPYVFHNWMQGKVKEQRGRLVDILADHWNKERPRGSWAPGAVRAEIAVSHLQRDSIPDTLEAAIRAQYRLDGMPEEAAAAAAARLAQPARDLVAETAPGKLGVEIRSMLGWRKDHGPIKGLGLKVKEALESAGLDVETHEGKLIREIAGEDRDIPVGEFGDRARPGHAKERSIDVPTRLIADFLDPSMKAGGADYARRMSAAVEMSNKFGDPSMMARLNATEAMLLEEVVAGRGTIQQMDEQLQAARDARDVVLGQFRIPEDPSALSIRVLRGLSNAAVMAQMGSALWANVADVGRVVMAHGMRDVLGAAYQAAVVDRGKWRLAGDEAAKAGAALEITLLGRQRDLQQLSDISADATLFEKGLDQGAKAMGFINLVAPWTEMLQRFSGAMHQSEMIELAVGSRAGTLTAEQAQKMGHYGITPRQADALAAAWEAAGGEISGKLHLANTDAWADQGLARAFRAQLATAVDISVMRPGAADRPNFMSAQLWQTTLLYKGFGIASSQRLVMAGMQQRDGRVLSGMLASASIAWLVGGAAGGPYDDHPILSSERLFQAIDRSGALGIIGDLNNAVETASSNAIGLRPLLQLDPPTFQKAPNWAQRTGAVAGPAVGPWLSAVAAFTDPEQTGDQRAGAIRRLLPLNNLIWTKDAFRAVQREAGSAVDWMEDDGMGGRRRAIALP